MRKIASKALIILLSASSLTACVHQPERKSLSKAIKHTIKSTRLLVNTTQHDMVIQHNHFFSYDSPNPQLPMDSGAVVKHKSGSYPADNFMPGQSLAVMLIASMTKRILINGLTHAGAKADLKKLAPIESSMGEFDFMRYFKNKLRQNLHQLKWLKLSKTALKFNLHQDENEIVNSKKDETLLIGTTYALNESLNRLEIVSYVKLDRKNKNEQKKQKKEEKAKKASKRFTTIDFIMFTASTPKTRVTN